MSNLTDEQLEDAINKLRNGDNSIKEKLILHYLKLSFAISKKYANIWGLKYYDLLVSEAMYTIVSVINEAKDKLVDNNLTKWLVNNIHWRLFDVVHAKEILGIPITTYIRYRRQNKDIVRPVRNSSDLLKIVVDNKANQQEEYEVNDLIEHIVSDEREKQILKMRLEGYTSKEIAENLGSYPVEIGRVIKEIRRKYFEEV